MLFLWETVFLVLRTFPIGLSDKERWNGGIMLLVEGAEGNIQSHCRFPDDGIERLKLVGKVKSGNVLQSPVQIINGGPLNIEQPEFLAKKVLLRFVPATIEKLENDESRHQRGFIEGFKPVQRGTILPEAIDKNIGIEEKLLQTDALF